MSWTVRSDMIAGKACPDCGERLSAVAFNASARTADGLARTCRACTNARRRRRERSGDRRPATQALSTVLATALRRGDLTTVRELVRSGTTAHWSWVCETMREGHLDLAEALLESGVERNIFTMAAMGDAKRLARRLVRARGDARLTASMEPASDRVTALHVGCASDWKPHGGGGMTTQVRVAEILAEYGADLHAVACYRGIGEATPLFCACWSSENVALVCWLLEHGARPGVAHLEAALGHLQRHGRAAYDIAEAILDWGVPVDGGVPGSRTPLQVFAHQANHRTVAWLIAHGADVNARSQGGRTAAHFAAERNTGPRTLALLVENGADLSFRDGDGRTPLELARLNEKPRLVEWIARCVRAKRR
jgi:ankyrin repeat protein